MTPEPEWTPEKLYEEYLPQFGCYQEAATKFQTLITDALADAGLSARSINARPKNPMELFKKQRKKNYPNPWLDCPDVVGARVVVSISSEKELVHEALHGFRQTEVFDVEDQSLGADPVKLKYKGLHAHIRNESIRNNFGDLVRCEVQIRTVAEDSWAETEHRYIYKGPDDIPSDVRRVFSRLLVLVELFDQELAKGVAMVTSLPEYDQIRFVRELEQEFSSRTNAPSDEQLTVETVHLLGNLGLGSVDHFREVLHSYLERCSGQVRQILDEHGPDTPSFNVRNDWLITQPESLLLLALLDENEYALSTHLQLTDLYAATENLALWTGHTGFLSD